MGKMIGIDLGTTNSVVAIVDGPAPRVLDNREAESQTRSVVSLKKRRGAKAASEEGEILVGDRALDNWPMAPRDTIISIKRLMGRGISDEEVQKVRKTALFEIQEPVEGTKDSVSVVMGGKQYSPIDISAMILGKLKSDAEFKLGDGVTVTHAVITVPAYFSQIQRDATRRAGLKAGLTVMKILDEPTAAAVAFGVDAADNSEPKTILVYDLGGGTFDISVLMWAGYTFAPLNLEGDMWLGGDNFDQVIVDQAVKMVKDEYSVDPLANVHFMVALKKAAQKVKETLSSSRSADLIVANLLKDADDNLISVELEVTLEQFEKWIGPLVDKTIRLTKKALERAGYTADQIDCVLMAGNSTKIPLVQRELEKLFGAKKVMRKMHPKHCVAMGAALLAARIGGLVCWAVPDPADPKRECGEVNALDATACRKCGSQLQPEAGLDLVEIGGIAPFHYGAQLANDEFRVFIEKNEPYPTPEPRRTQTFYTQIPNQRVIAIPVYGGEVLEKASANQKQGEVFAILSAGLSKGAGIRVSVWLNENGEFDLTAHLEDGTDLRPWILRGEADAKAVEAIEEVERALAERAASLSADDLGKIDAARNRAFDLMRAGDFHGALGQANAVVDMAEEFQGEQKDELIVKAENLIGFGELVLHQYGWALDPNRSYRLGSLIEETKSALTGLEKAKSAQKADARQVLETKAGALDKETDNLPEAVQVFLSMRGAIGQRIGPRDPALAANLMIEVGAVEQAFQGRQPTAEQKLQSLVAKLAKAMEGGGGAVDFPCPKCNRKMPKGAQKCPACGWDSRHLVGEKGSTTDNVFRR